MMETPMTPTPSAIRKTPMIATGQSERSNLYSDVEAFMKSQECKKKAMPEKAQRRFRACRRRLGLFLSGIARFPGHFWMRTVFGFVSPGFYLHTSGMTSLVPRTRADLRGFLVRSGALLFGVGLFTGIWAGLTLSGVVHVNLPRLALGAHLNGLMGGLWMLAVSYSFEFLKYSDQQLRRLVFWVVVPSWGNWAITLAASALGVSGLLLNSSVANNGVTVLLQSVVVIPALIAAFYWVRGFYRGVDAA